MLNTALMSKYPQTDRTGLLAEREAVSEADRVIARRFDRAYFDTERRFGYGGYHYDERFFGGVVQDFISHYGLEPGMRVLDVGCGKGFMLHDFLKACPGLIVAGVDISDYALQNSLPDVKPYLQWASCDSLPFEDKSFDLVISIATIHNLDVPGVAKSLHEITRVSKGWSFIKVNGYRNEAEKEALNKWNLVAKTILADASWEVLFAACGYTGDYDFFRT